MKKIKITQDEANPIPQEVVAGAIVKIAEAMDAIEQTRLSRKAIIALIADDTGLGKGTIKTVLESLEGMEKSWLKPKQKK